MIFKQVMRRALAAVSGFGIGVALSSSPRPTPDESHTGPQALSICEALQHPRLLNQENIRLRGMLYGNPDGTLVLNELDCSGDGMWLAVSLDDSVMLKEETRLFLDRMRRQSRGETMARAEVLIFGRLAGESGTGDIAAPPQTVSVKELEPLTQVSIVSFVSN